MSDADRHWHETWLGMVQPIGGLVVTSGSSLGLRVRIWAPRGAPSLGSGAATSRLRAITVTRSHAPVPPEPLGFIRRCLRERRILWTYHVNMRLAGRHIPREWILAAEREYELVESYPHDKYLPSYLLRGEHKELVFHVLFAADMVGDNVRVVTAYRPTADVWDEDGRRRRSR